MVLLVCVEPTKGIVHYSLMREDARLLEPGERIQLPEVPIIAAVVIADSGLKLPGPDDIRGNKIVLAVMSSDIKPKETTPKSS